MNRRALALFLLAPALGEMLSGSTPPLAFLNPLVFGFQAGLYGSGAILAREFVRRRHQGWRSVVLVGAAYGIFEEALVVTSWYNAHWPDLRPLAGKATVLDINWIWALGLTEFHAVVSITGPILLVEAWLDQADRSWVGNRTVIALTALLGCVSVIGLYGFGFHNFRSVGYSHPPPGYVIGIVLALVLLFLAARPGRAERLPAAAGPPHPWMLRAAGFAAGAAWFFGLWVLPSWTSIGALPVTVLAILAAASAWVVGRWSSRDGWGHQQRLALITGALGFVIALTPLGELSGKRGMVAVGLLLAVWLAWLARRASAPLRLQTS